MSTKGLRAREGSWYGAWYCPPDGNGGVRLGSIAGPFWDFDGADVEPRSPLPRLLSSCPGGAETSDAPPTVVKDGVGVGSKVVPSSTFCVGRSQGVERKGSGVDIGCEVLGACPSVNGPGGREAVAGGRGCGNDEFSGAVRSCCCGVAGDAVIPGVLAG